MQEKHGPAKETDITNILVITFVVLVAVMIAKVAGDFTSKSTSTSTKAAPPTRANLSDRDYCIQKVKGNTHFIPTTEATSLAPKELTYYAQQNKCNNQQGEIEIYSGTRVIYDGINTKNQDISCCLNPSGYNRREIYRCNPYDIVYNNNDKVQMVGVECKDTCTPTTPSTVGGEYYVNIKAVLTEDSNIGYNTKCKIARTAAKLDSAYCCMKVKDIIPTSTP